MYIRQFSRKPFFSRRQYYFSINAENGEILAASEGYNNKNDRNTTIESIKRGSLLAEIIDADEGKDVK